MNFENDRAGRRICVCIPEGKADRDNVCFNVNLIKKRRLNGYTISGWKRPKKAVYWLLELALQNEWISVKEGFWFFALKEYPHPLIKKFKEFLRTNGGSDGLDTKN